MTTLLRALTIGVAAAACATAAKDSVKVGDEVPLLATGPGCSQREIYDRWRSLQKDPAAAYVYLTSGVGCRGFDSTTMVFIEALDSSAARIHVSPDPTPYWIERRLVDSLLNRPK